MDEKINRIVILDDKVHGDLYRCGVCGVNFTTIQPCIVCSLVIEKEKELGRKLNKDEFHKLIDWLK